ncbi:hypothetical protein CVT25_011946, partial [Psilocybe cyanescens]
STYVSDLLTPVDLSSPRLSKTERFCPQALTTQRMDRFEQPLRRQYLQTGKCGFNGDNCITVETTLVNPTSPGSGSSTDLSLIPPLKFSVTTGFGYYGGCDGAGASCNNANCNTAFRVPTDTFVQVACQSNNVNLAITFC